MLLFHTVELIINSLAAYISDTTNIDKSIDKQNRSKEEHAITYCRSSTITVSAAHGELYSSI